ncbi:MAG: hypothetical protein KKF42_09165 [Actinobacteria bacterium]|nr:hypothetical protein [Actinomycetota bacterium]
MLGTGRTGWFLRAMGLLLSASSMTIWAGDSIISFISDGSSKTIIYPEQTSVELSEAQYEVQVYVYKNSSIKLEEKTHEQCIEVPKSGLGGLVGLSEEKCFDIDIPAQIISNALAGGGKENYYILESELESSSSIEISAEKLPTPSSIELELSNSDSKI